jgi:Uup-like ABC transporter family protein
VNNQPLGKRKLSFKEQKELAALESEIQGERRQAEIEAELANNSSDAQLVHQLYQERELLIAKLAGALDRWADLA